MRHYCPLCEGLCKPRFIKNGLVYDCQNCGEQIANGATIRNY